MMDAPPVLMTWEGDCFRPYGPRQAAACDEHFVVGQKYSIVEHHQRSMPGHRRYFAAINEAFKNLPDEQAERFASADHLRRWALIQCGYRDERSIVCASKAEAHRVAAFVKPMDEYAVVVVRGSVVLVLTAKSQSMKAMGKQTFESSKTAVLDKISAMIGVTQDELTTNARQVA